MIRLAEENADARRHRPRQKKIRPKNLYKTQNTPEGGDVQRGSHPPPSPPAPETRRRRRAKLGVPFSCPPLARFLSVCDPRSIVPLQIPPAVDSLPSVDYYKSICASSRPAACSASPPVLDSAPVACSLVKPIPTSCITLASSGPPPAPPAAAAAGAGADAPALVGLGGVSVSIAAGAAGAAAADDPSAAEGFLSSRSCA